MSTHRKIEWSLFVIGLIGLFSQFFLGADLLTAAILAIVTQFAGLHVFHWYDGHKANHVVVAGALLLVIYTGYLAISKLSSITNEYSATASFVLGVALLILSLRLRRDFHKQ